MDGAKIQFSVAEKRLMLNANIILTKNALLEKVRLLLEGVQYSLTEHKTSDAVFLLPPKISRGENYLGLPYLVLDYPRQFKSENIFMLRSFFWWGHFFSATLHLSGAIKEQYLHQIKNRYKDLATAGYYIGSNEDQWQHHFKTDNYRLIAGLSEPEFRDYCHRFEHLKIAKSWPLENETAANDLIESALFFMRLLNLIAA